MKSHIHHLHETYETILRKVGTILHELEDDKAELAMVVLGKARPFGWQDADNAMDMDGVEDGEVIRLVVRIPSGPTVTLNCRTNDLVRTVKA